MEEIGQEEIQTAMHKMKKRKATGSDEVRLDMLEMAGEVGVKWTGRLLNVCMQEGRIPKEWRMGLIVPIWKRKGDVHVPGQYRGITLLIPPSHRRRGATTVYGQNRHHRSDTASSFS